ncbi:hydroxymethylbilane synthase [Riemerella anatipestifer]|nr:hydroxymethylbilane synthase [Riemerella anatipestifer]
MSLMKNTIKIGTRNSPLALWQAKEVAAALEQKNYATEIVPIVSSGDKNLTQPLYSLGITGVFTKDLDIALLNRKIDIAVHSLKDVPTQLPQNIELIAYLERDYPQDVLVRSSNAKDKPLEELKIATSSLRRRAFWLKQFPNTEFSDIRGNVQTRLQKLEDGIADATLFSLAGLKRMALDIPYEHLPFMISAPSQGVVTVAGHTDNTEINEIVKTINHHQTQVCVEIERQFLNRLEGGCTAPIGAFAEFNEEEIKFQGRLCSLNGKECLELNETFAWKQGGNFGDELADKLLANGGKAIMDQIKKEL